MLSATPECCLKNLDFSTVFEGVKITIISAGLKYVFKSVLRVAKRSRNVAFQGSVNLVFAANVCNGKK